MIVIMGLFNRSNGNELRTYELKDLLNEEDQEVTWSYIPHYGSAFLNLYRAEGKNFGAVTIVDLNFSNLSDFFRRDTNYQVKTVDLLLTHPLEELKDKMAPNELAAFISGNRFTQFRDANEGLYGNCLFEGMTKIGKELVIDHKNFSRDEFRSTLKGIVKCDRELGKKYGDYIPKAEVISI
jgi:hypothetical protein